ncbi:MAG: DUF4922 domain-containing protein [Acidobacteriota bacterium]
MNWHARMLNADELKPYQKSQSEYGFRDDVVALIEHQKENWSALGEGYAALSQIETRRIESDGSSVVVQHNPRRVRSTAAAVDRASIEARKCFLCADHLPAEEKGIAYDENLVILCNPFPVLDNHLVITHKNHVEQKIDGHIEDLLALAFDLGEAFFVLYNGAECGASAPDHFHLQACSRKLLPIDEVLKNTEPSADIDCDVCEDLARRDFELFTLGDFGRSAIVFRAASRIEITNWAYQVIQALAAATGKPEPMMNLIAYFERGIFTLILFPRARHRPACFYGEGEARMMISPGAVDMAGILVMPEQAHYEKIDAGQIEAIFKEVSLPIEQVEEILEPLCAIQTPVGF